LRDKKNCIYSFHDLLLNIKMIKQPKMKLKWHFSLIDQIKLYQYKCYNILYLLWVSKDVWKREGEERRERAGWTPRWRAWVSLALQLRRQIVESGFKDFPSFSLCSILHIFYIFSFLVWLSKNKDEIFLLNSFYLHLFIYWRMIRPFNYL